MTTTYRVIAVEGPREDWVDLDVAFETRELAERFVASIEEGWFAMEIVEDDDDGDD